MSLATNLEALVLFAIASAPGFLSDNLPLPTSSTLIPGATSFGNTNSSSIRTGGLCTRWKG